MLREGVIMLCGPLVPLRRQADITRDTPPVFVKDAETILGFRHTLFRSFPVPSDCLHIVAGQTAAIFMHHADGVLCFCIPGFSKRLP